MILLAACHDPAPASHPASATSPVPAAARTDAGPAAVPGNQHAAPITGAQARDLVAHGASLLDVRTAEEFAAGHLPGAINIPVELVWRRYGEIPPGLVVVYCASGNRSARARRILGAFGREAYDLGPMSSW
ncbi:MAG: rhodanese-like domain-containing protein [Deltaproteobacteria bacterium]